MDTVMSNEERRGGWILVIIFCVATAVMVTIGATNYSWRTETIKRGFAEYNTTTGKWQWKEMSK